MSRFAGLGVVLAVLAVAWVLLAQNGRRKGPPEKYEPGVAKAFFKNVLDAVGPGDGPSAGGGAAAATTNTPGGGTGESPKGEWSQLVSSDSLVSEIKAAVNEVQPAVVSKTKWGTGHRKVRKAYSVMAVCFAVLSQYDGEARFKDHALAMRDPIARSGFNSKVNTDGAWQEAKRRLEEVQQMMRGGNVDLPKPEEAKVPFSKVSDRSPLMQRMEKAQQQNLKPKTSSIAEFKANKDEILKEAEILGMLAKVIEDSGFEYAEDDDYRAASQAIQKASREIVEAVKLDSLEKAQAAVGTIAKSCSGCHENYR